MVTTDTWLNPGNIKFFAITRNWYTKYNLFPSLNLFFIILFYTKLIDMKSVRGL